MLMYETESNRKVESIDQISPDAITAFVSLVGKIEMRTLLPWSEHCTECVWPTCYTTCDLYSPREDGRCRRFVDGMVRIECPEASNGYLLKIRFKQWGKLWTPASLSLHSSAEAAQIERKDHRLGAVLYNLPLPNPLKKLAVTKRYSWKKRQAAKGTLNDSLPTAFLCECYNPADKSVDLSFTIRPAGAAPKIPFQALKRVDPGYTLVRIPYGEISGVVDLSRPFNVELIPNGVDKEITLYFGLLDFVQERPQSGASAKPVKCVVWDLDNTLWDGVLVEDGLARLTLKPGIQAIMRELDRRGVLQSVASKNNPLEALGALQRFGLQEMFLYPEISWGPKGEAIARIATNLNIGIDSLLFIDDQEFERKQVEAMCGGVRTLDSKHYGALLEMEQLSLSVTNESANRRELYKVEQERKEVEAKFKDDYKAFLKHCNIHATVTPLTESNLERVHELTQRTNQMNFSGNRYDREVLRQILTAPHLDTYVLSCEDRYGSYGIVGFGIVDTREPRLTDLMFSCRIQSKRVEHALLRAIISRYLKETGKDFCANYRKTERNHPSGCVFNDLGLVEVGEADGVALLVFPYGRDLADDQIVEMEFVDNLTMAGERA
jgi:FkbH-like protein